MSRSPQRKIECARVVGIAACLLSVLSCGPSELPAFANPPPEDVNDAGASPQGQAAEQDTDAGPGESNLDG